MRSRSSTTPHLPSYFLLITSIQLFHHQSYGHTFPVPNEPSKSEVHQIPRHPAMICIELPHFFYSQCSMVSPSIISLSRMLRYYRNHYSYWFFLLYCSVISRSFLNFSTLFGFIFPAFKAFLLAFSQFRWSCSSIRCFDGFRWFSSRNPITSSYLAIHLSSCVIYNLSSIGLSKAAHIVFISTISPNSHLHQEISNSFQNELSLPFLM